MKRIGACLAVSVLLRLAASAQTLPELFQKAKAQVKGESWTEALKTLDAVEAEAGLPGNEGAKRQLAAPIAFYRGVCEANLGQTEKAKADFAAFLELQPNATMDPSMYSKKALAAFEAARLPLSAAAASDGRPAMFVAFQEFKLPPNSGERVNEAWGDGPVRWIMTADEKRTWSQLSSGAEWQEFVDKFWESRNPQPGNPDNSYRTGFERRVGFADANFVQVEGTRGSMTDRGMVFILLGPPTYVGRKPLRAGGDGSDAEGLASVGSQDAGNALKEARADGKLSGHAAAAAADRFMGPGTQAPDSGGNWREVWHYRRELLPKGVRYQQVDVEFITRKGYGSCVMQRETQTLATLEAARVGPKKG